MKNNIDKLLENLNSEDETTRKYSAEDIGIIKAKEGIVALVKGLSDVSRAVAEACADSLVRIGGIEVARALSPFLATEDIKLRNLSAEILSLLGDSAVEEMLHQLNSKDRDVRKFAVDILIILNNGNSMYGLIKALDDPDINIAATAADAIGAIGNENHIDILEKYLDSDIWMKSAIIRGIGNIGGQKAYHTILSCLKHNNVMIKFSCINALGNIQIPNCIIPLLELLESESIDLFGEEILSAIEKTIQGQPSYNYSLLNLEQFSPLFKKIILEGNIKAKLKTINIIGYLKVLSILPILIELFSSDVPEIRKKSVHAVIKMDPKDLSLLENVLNNSSKSVEAKAAAIHSIGCLSNPNRLKVIQKFLNIEDPILTRVTLDALYQGIKPIPFDEITNLLHSKYKNIRYRTAVAMGKIGDPVFIHPLIDQLNKSDTEFIELVNEALTKIGTLHKNLKVASCLNCLNLKERKIAFQYFDVENIKKETILAGFQHRNKDIRIISLKILENLNWIDLDIIEKGLLDTENIVKLESVRALHSMILDENIVFFIQKQLKKNPFERLKVEFVRVLSLLGDYGSSKILLNLLEDPSIWVQVEVIEAIKSVGDKSIIPNLKKLLTSKNKDVLEAAQNAIEELGI